MYGSRSGFALQDDDAKDVWIPFAATRLQDDDAVFVMLSPRLRGDDEGWG
ncbi:hypothetical protein [Fibrobacter sp.]